MNLQQKFINKLITVFIILPIIVHAQNNVNQANVYTSDKPNIMVKSTQPVFIIKLKSNPTTGYSWFLREYDRDLIQLLTHTFERPSTGLMGAPGYELWTFSVKPTAFSNPQQSTVVFNYARPWEGMSNATKAIFKITILPK